MKRNNLYPDTIERKIGFDSVRKFVTDRCLSSLGAAKCAEMAFTSDFRWVARSLGCVAEMCAIRSSGEDFPLGGVHDLTSQLKAVRVAGTHMSENDLMRLRASLTTVGEIASFLRLTAPMTALPPHILILMR